jgi:hypothetical protein
MFLSTLSLLNAVKADLAGRHFIQSSSTAPAILSNSSSDPKLFELVEISSDQDLVVAMKRLRVMNSRVCLIVPLHDDYANKKEGMTFQSERAMSFMLLITDRDITPGAGTMQPNIQTPGILNLKDLVVAALTQKSKSITEKDLATGANVSFVVALIPHSGAMLRLEWEEGGNKPGSQSVVGRECWTHIFTVPHAGIVRTNIGRQ